MHNATSPHPQAASHEFVSPQPGTDVHASSIPITSSAAYVTKEDLESLLLSLRKGSGVSCVQSLRLPYPTHIAVKPYPKDYTSPKFKQFNGKGDAKEHVMKFTETLGVYALDEDLMLKEFSKSLEGKDTLGTLIYLLVVLIPGGIPAG